MSLAPKGAVSDAYGLKRAVLSQAWDTLAASFRGNLFTVSLGGEKLFGVEDSTFATAGKTGLWAKSDGVICFGDFRVSEEGKK